VPRAMVGLLAAVGAVASAAIGFARGYLIWLVFGIVAMAAGLVTYVTASVKKNPSMSDSLPVFRRSRRCAPLSGRSDSSAFPSS
jgi:hypothetical protein